MGRGATGSYSSCIDNRARTEANATGRVDKENSMLKWALIFAVIAAVAGLFGFTGIAAGAAGIAKILFIVFLVLFVAVVLLALLGIGAVS
jgi:uncharacterized membrane protein YtjA (UPF0391 family)